MSTAGRASIACAAVLSLLVGCTADAAAPGLSPSDAPAVIGSASPSTQAPTTATATASPTRSGASPSAPVSAATPSVRVAATSIAQDTLVDPVVTGTASAGAGVLVEGQVVRDKVWTTVARASTTAGGAFVMPLSLGRGELRSDAWRFVAGGAVSPVVTVQRTAVVNPSVTSVAASEVAMSWREGCPSKPDELRLLAVNYYGFDGLMHRGRLVVHASVADDVVDLMQVVIDSRFPIRQMRPIDEFEGSDETSADEDNTSAFNCRRTPLGTYWSEHSNGVAIDFNPVENPYHKDNLLIPSAGEAYLNRSDVRPGMLVADSPVVKYAQAHGWLWLAPDDPQHLEKTR